MRWRESLIARCCRRATRRSGLVLVVAAALLALGVRAQGGRQGDPFSPEPVEVRIGGSVYAIPRNYLLYVSTAIDGKTANIVMRALWPGLEPLRPDNAYLWERRRPERQVHIVLLARPRSGYDELRGFAQLRSVLGEPSQFGLIRYRSQFEEYYTSTELEQRTPNGLPIALKCWDYSDETKHLFEVERNCIVEYPMVDEVGLRYEFFMANLSGWREIDHAVRALVNGFRRQ